MITRDRLSKACATAWGKPLTSAALLGGGLCVAMPALTVEEMTRTELAPDTETGAPYSWHQNDVLKDFRIADRNQDGVLNAAEYEVFAARRETKSNAYVATKHQSKVLRTARQQTVPKRPMSDRAANTAANMPATPHQKSVSDEFNPADETYAASPHQKEALKNVKTKPKPTRPLSDAQAATRANVPASPHQQSVTDEFNRVDKNRDAAAGFMEIYYFETFERPGVFPPRGESIPQEITGHWETLIREEHPKVNYNPPFSTAALRRAVAEGGFDSVDANNDGYVSIFEASDRSMLHWTRNIYQFESADMDGNWLLTKAEFQEFQDLMVSDMVENQGPAARPGEFPSGGGGQ